MSHTHIETPVRLESRPDGHARHRYRVRFAQSASEVRAAQRLRHQVFVEEFGANLQGDTPGIDADRFDPHCEHLIVRDEGAGRIVGTYRVLPPAAARAAGGLYSDDEFHLERLERIRSQMVEVGRSCIAADHRNGAVITLLWAKLAEYMVANCYEYLVGCASVPMHDGGHNAANLYRRLSENHMAPAEYRVTPRTPLPFERLADGRPVETPPLVKGYLRAGAMVCGEPAWDPDFNSADFLLLLSMARLPERHRRHFLR